MALEFFDNFEIQEFLFHEVLRIDRGTSLITGDIGRDILFVLIIPSILGILVLRDLAKRAVGSERGSLATMVGIAGLGFIIYGGWYTLLAQFAVFVFALWLFVSLGSWGYHKVLGNAGHNVVMSGAAFFKKKAAEKGMGKDGKKAIAKIKDLARRVVNGYKVYYEAQMQIASLADPQDRMIPVLREEGNAAKISADQAITEIEKMRVDYDESEELIDACKKAYEESLRSVGNSTIETKIKGAVSSQLGF